MEAGLLRPGPMAEPAAVARAIAASLAPQRAADAPPIWLDPDQADAFRLLLHALRIHGAVLCADPVGTGKTYVALAVAQALGGGPPLCLVPAPLIDQWQATARRLEVPVRVWSHTRASRGTLPAGPSALVIVDESHHFRRPTTRRYRTLAPWLAGRRLLLLSATPVVNSAWDLYHQLHLGLRDDALAFDGSPSLRAAFSRSDVPPALGRYVLERLEPKHQPRTRSTALMLTTGAEALLEGLDRLALSAEPGIAALVRAVLLQAAASSAAALHASLLRYRALLLQARDASEAGQSATRRRLRRLLSGGGDQLELWALLPDGADGDTLALSDLSVVERLVPEARSLAGTPDDKSRHLSRLLRDQATTIAFVSTPDTIPFLRAQLASCRPAWCTGRGAGIGGVTLDRPQVLGWFRPGAPDLQGRPRLLLSTDVAAEGLDLHGAERVVHYDLPWTDVRMTQRDGRAVRRGSTTECVELVRFLPTRAVESRLRQVRVLATKSALPGTLGIGPTGRLRWRWRREVSDALAGPSAEGVAALCSDHPGWLAGIALECGGNRVATTALWRPEGGEWSSDPGAVEHRLEEASAARGCVLPDLVAVHQELRALEPLCRALVREASSLRHAGVQPGAAAARLGHRLRRIGRAAAHDRNRPLLDRIAVALAFASGSHTAGEAMRVEALLALDDARLFEALAALPPSLPNPAPLHAHLIGLLRFQG